MRILTIIAFAAALATSATAQRGGFGGGGHAGGFSGAGAHGGAPAGRAPLPSFAQPRGGGFAFGRSASSYGSRFDRYGPYGSFLGPLFGDYDLDDLYASGYPVASQPPTIPLQDALAMLGSKGLAAATDFQQPGPAEPLMIELKGDQYVRVKSAAANSEAQPIAQDTHLARDDAPPSTVARASTRSPHAPDLPPAILIFRDGHSEQVRDYTIADGVLYAHGDFYTDGYWNKQIALASLDLPQTVQANASRNVQFTLPSSPNEVITRF
jgi:hypothetical protein